MAITEQDVLMALRSVQDPDLHKDIVALNQVKSIKLLEDIVAIEVSTPSPQKQKLREAISAAVMVLPGVDEVMVNFSAGVGAVAAPQGQGHGHAHGARPGGPGAGPSPAKALKGVKHIVAVGAGKGGVGKSTIAVNLAIALGLMGKRVALLDGDIYGPSVPTMVGLPPTPPAFAGTRILPFLVEGSAGGKTLTLPVMSIGFMVDKEKALIWRGPMAHGAMKQMLEEVDWTGEAAGEKGGELDYLIVDLPPGTGDISLTLAQTVPLTGAVIVATPQEVALADARRAVRMFQQLGVEILGVVENMSYFVCDHGTEYDIFGKGGAKTMAQQMGLPFLGDVPIHTALRRNSDDGKPFANFSEKSPSRAPLMKAAEMLDQQVAIRLATRPMAKALTLEVS